MARIKNDLFKFSGSLGGLSFSQDEFGTIVKQKPESNKKIKTSTRSQRSREHNVEMGGASTAAKILRVSFLRHDKISSDRYFSGRLNGLMRKTIAMGSGQCGERKLDLRKNGSMLETFEFINARPLVYSIGGIKEKPTTNSYRNAIYWTSPTLDARKHITAPKEATHFTFILCAASVSNYQYESTQNKYRPMEPNHFSLSTLAESELITLKQKTIAPRALSLTLTDTVAIPEEVAVVSAVGVRFYRDVNGEILEMKDVGAMRILGVV